MNKIILVVEDKKTEQSVAKELVLNNGTKVIIANTLYKAENFIKKFSDKLLGIITDMHFPIDDGINAEGANGISVVLTALQHNIPCVVCTDDVAHGAQYIALAIERLELLTSHTIPISSNKDWANALEKLISLTEDNQ